MGSDERTDDERVLFRGEVSAVYCFDFQDFPEVTAGGLLSAPTVVVSGGNAALVTLGPSEVTTVTFEQIDRDGVVEKSVPPGMGVKVAVTPPAVLGPKGEVTVSCFVGLPGGVTRAKRCKFVVK